MSPEREALADLGRRIDACKAKHGITPLVLALRRVKWLLDAHDEALRRLGVSAREAARAMKAFRKMQARKCGRWR